MRASGILMPISSLPSRYGIGSFSKSGYEFVDFLAASRQKYWQILPLGPTGYGDSPYQSFSTFAGNPYYIDLDTFVDNGLLTRKECESFYFGSNERYVDYGQIYNTRFKVLRIAYGRSGIGSNPDFMKYLRDNEYWIKDYGLYMAVKNHFDNVSWSEWPEDIRLREPEAIKSYELELADEIEFYQFLQYEFTRQWASLKKYANDKQIKIIGDIPIYMAFDSADSWANPQLFQFGEDSMPIAVAGCPPDAFAATGQLWGNPLYDWEYHKKTSYAWWVKRMEYCFTIYDVVRVDHFRGFDEYYSIPADHTTAEKGTWVKGPGYEIFQELRNQLGGLDIIAEDLGYLTESVIELVAKTGYPGMKVLEFAFDSREESDYLPHNYNKNCVVYTGTHDNQTLKGWIEEIPKEDKEMALDYIGLSQIDEQNLHWNFIRLALASVADMAIIPIQDYLGLGAEARINRPSTLGGNWMWRMLDGELTDDLVNRIKAMTRLYGR